MPLTPSSLQIAFRNSNFVRHFFFYPSIGSTNEKAVELARVGAEGGTVVIADGQTAGQGRSGRRWFSPPGLGLYSSFIFRPGVPAENSFGVHMAVALGTAEAVESQKLQSVVGIKWPNDLMAEGKKMAGILSEIHISGGLLQWCVTGVGLNVNMTRNDFPPDLREKAISLREICHRNLDRTSIMTGMTERVGEWYERFLKDGMAALVPEWRRRSTIMGRMVRVETAGETYMGTAMGLEENGALRIKLESGAEELLVAGDVHLVQYR